MEPLDRRGGVGASYVTCVKTVWRNKTNPRTRMPYEGMSKTKRNFLRVGSAKCISFCCPFLCDAMSCHLISRYTSPPVPIVLCLVTSFRGICNNLAC